MNPRHNGATMERRVAVTVVAAVALVLLVAAAGWMVHTDRLAMESHTSTYSYDVTVETDATLANVTVLAPLPDGDEDSPVLEALRSGNGNVSVPAGWNASVTETRYGPMLRLTADTVEPRFRNASPTPLADRAVADDGGDEQDEPAGVTAEGDEDVEPDPATGAPTSHDLHVSVEVPGDIDTRNATETEPLLAPTLNATPVECDWPHPDDWDDRLRCLEFDTRFRLQYDADVAAGNGSPRVGLSVEHGGSNAWWVYGWSGNEYRQRARLDAVGRTGWLRADGLLVEGEGNYR